MSFNVVSELRRAGLNPNYIDELLESGHRCPACGGKEFEALQLNRIECLRFNVDAGWTDSPPLEETAPDVMLGTVRVSCAACGFLLWSILAELEATVIRLQAETPLRPADAEGRTTFAEAAE